MQQMMTLQQQSLLAAIPPIMSAIGRPTAAQTATMANEFMASDAPGLSGSAHAESDTATLEEGLTRGSQTQQQQSIV